MDFGYNRQNPDAYSCEFLKMSRHWVGFIVEKLFKVKKNPNSVQKLSIAVCRLVAKPRPRSKQLDNCRY
jgi:hypothetical protein